MNLGVGIPNGSDRADIESVVEFGMEVEALGFDSLWVMDRWLRPTAPVRMPGVAEPVRLPASSYRTVFDPLELLAYLAARTSTIALGTSAVNVLYQPPVLLARRLATLDHLSRGRLVAGVVSGWMREEFLVAGVPPEYMGDGFEEHLAAMRAVWGSDPVVFQGDRYVIPSSDIGPKPWRRESIPLFVGYNTKAGIRRAARIADGLHPFRNDLAALHDDLTIYEHAVAAAGYSRQDLQVVLRTTAAAQAGERGSSLFTGPVEAWVEDLHALAGLGVDHVLVQLSGDASDVLRTLAALQRFRDL